MQQIFVTLEYIGHNPQAGIHLIEKFSRKYYYMCFLLNLEKVKRKQNFWEKYKLVLFPFNRIEDPLEFCIIQSRLKDPLADPFK